MMKRFFIFLLAMAMMGGGVAKAATVDILLYGDSLLSGHRLRPEENLAVLLEKKLAKDGIKVRVRNASVVGSTSVGGLARIDKVLQKQYDLVVLEFGGNDVYRKVPAATVKKNLQTMIDRIVAQKGQVLLVGNRSAALAGIYKDLAKKNNLQLYPYMMLGVSGRKDLTLDDNIHPNAAGVRVMLRNIAPVIKKILRS